MVCGYGCGSWSVCSLVGCGGAREMGGCTGQVWRAWAGANLDGEGLGLGGKQGGQHKFDMDDKKHSWGTAVELFTLCSKLRSGKRRLDRRSRLLSQQEGRDLVTIGFREQWR